MNNLIVIERCEVCKNKSLKQVLNLGMHPICDDLIPIGSDRINEEYPINIKYCETCYTAHHAYQIPKKLLFPSTYHYRARFTKDVIDGMRSLVTNIETLVGNVKNKIVLDVGCNDGSLLNIFKDKGAITYGVEPTDAYLDAIKNGHNIINNYFDVTVAETLPKPDIITFTNVFAHIEDLNSLLDALKILMTKDTLLVIENHYLGGVLEKNQFDTFYHEHPRTYSLNSFLYISKTLERDVLSVEFPSRYGGNIRVIIGNKNIKQNSDKLINDIITKESSFLHQFELINLFITSWKIKKKEEILNYIEKNGKIEAKALPARSAIPLKLLGLNETHIKCVYEKPGSMKIGNYVPSTRIPIVSDNELIKDIINKKGILNNAWHISNEIENYLINLGFKGNIINII
jgi:SAM-dependent methyltransferase